MRATLTDGSGNYQVFGSRTADLIEIGGAGRYEFDASFNSGLDTIEVGRAAADFTARMEGSKRFSPPMTWS